MEAMTERPLVNRVANSGLSTIDLEQFYPAGAIAPLDLKAHLFMGLILKEKDFREAMQNHDWAQYEGQNVAVFCSADAVVPMWAYMLVASHAAPFADDVLLAEPERAVEAIFLKKLAALDVSEYAGQRVVVKGCSARPVPPSAYLEITRRLRPIARSLMFGEPCSTVPVFKNKAAAA